MMGEPSRARSRSTGTGEAALAYPGFPSNCYSDPNFDRLGVSCENLCYPEPNEIC